MNKYPRKDRELVYYAGWNLPGCLPEMEPFAFSTFETARDWLTEELTNAPCLKGDGAAFDALAEKARTATEPFALAPAPDGYVYWVDAYEAPRVNKD